MERYIEKDKTKQELSGIMPPVVTPFDETGEVEPKEFRKEIEKMLSLGVSGISVGGSTGEGQTLSDLELKQLVEIAVETVNNKVPIIGGIITESTVQAVKRGQILKELGVKALMVTPIHYLFSDGDNGNYSFYAEIRKKVEIPIIAYNVVPWNVISPEILVKMLKSGILFGVKQSGGDIHALGSLLSMARRQFPIFTALDDMLFPSFALGASGSIAAINTLLPKTSVKLYKSVVDGDYSTALKLHEAIIPITKKILLSDMPARIKFVMNRTGWNVGYARKPLREPSNSIAEELINLSKEVAKLEEEMRTGMA